LIPVMHRQGPGDEPRKPPFARWVLLPFLVCGALLIGPAGWAAPPERPAASAVQPAPASSPELERLVNVLQDPAARARLVAELRALIAAERAHPASATPSPKPPTASVVFGQLAQRIDDLAREVVAGAAVVVDAPRLFGWARTQIVDASARQRHRDSRAVRALFALSGLVVSALPILAFAGVAYVAMSLLLDVFTPTRVMLSVLVEATVEVRLILCLAAFVLVPTDPGALFVGFDAETRDYLYVWSKRFAICGVYGYALPEAGWWLGIPGALYALLLKAAGLLLALLAIVFVLQNRAPVARRLAGASTHGSGWRRLRRSLGEVWHLAAILYIVGLYLIYALHIEGGFAYVLRASALSLVIILAAQLLMRAIRALSRRGFALSPALKAKFPTLEHRANRYLPILTGLCGAAVYGLAGLGVLRAWGFAAFAWLGTDLGRQIAGQLLSTGLILAAALALWEIVDSAIERYRNGLGSEAGPRRTRLPTLLPFLRTAALCLFAVLTALTVLSHVGIDIAPLLAGAGIIGVAIGFGSQTLVRDVITGLFMLVEDQLAVGDVIDVGGDHAGVVEAITIRTLRLRDLAGTVHTVPFSSVITVKNLTKDFAYVVARVTISYREDIDRVVAILREVCDRLMEDETLRPLILDPFDYQGVDSLDQFWVTLLLRIRTQPLQQWTVGRAFNRLVKIAFEEHGIAMRDPSPILLAGSAPQLVPASAPERRRA